MTLFNDEPTLPDSSLTYDQLIEKYTDNEGIAKAMTHKELFINQLKTEQSGMRADLETRIKNEEFLDRMNSLLTGNNNKGAPSPQDDTSDKTPIAPPLDIESLLDQRDAKKRQEENLLMVERKLAETLGPNSGSKLKQRAIELDMSESDLVNIAKQNPKAFFQLIGIENTSAQQMFTPPPRNQLNTEFKPSGSNQHKKFSDYEVIRKTKPTEYWSPRIQNEMKKLTEQFGDDFINN